MSDCKSGVSVYEIKFCIRIRIVVLDFGNDILV